MNASPFVVMSRIVLLVVAAACCGLDSTVACARQAPPAGGEPTLLGQPRTDFKARRRDLMKSVQTAFARRGNGSSVDAIIVLRGDDDRGKEDFEEGRFRQKNDFAYLTGVEVPGAYLVLLPKEERETLYLPPAGGNRFMSGDRPPGPGSATEQAFGIDHVVSTDRFLGDLFSAIGDPLRPSWNRSHSAVVYTRSPNAPASSASPDAKFVRFLREGAPQTEFEDIAPAIGELRKAKSKTELAILQKAIDITGRAQEEVMQTIRPGLFEYQLESKILGAFLEGGALRPGFASIVGSGPNSTIPHYFDNQRQLADGDMVVVDIGAEYQYYTADITRTYPANGKFTPRQREIYQLVLDAQADAARKVKPGVSRLAELTGWTRAYLRQSPLRARDQRGQEQTMDYFFIHGLSHYLGMEVHDVGDITKPFQVGEVFTIEPGLYIRSENLGVRIEDDYLMTPDGPEKMSKGIASDPDEIEKRIGQARAARAGSTAREAKIGARP